MYVGSGQRANRHSKTRLMIVGAGEAGQSLVREILDSTLPVLPVAFLDDDSEQIGKQICNLPVFGPTSDLVAIAKQVDAQEILIAIPSSPGSLIRQLVILCRQAVLPFKIVPGIRAIIEGDVSYEQIRRVAPEDLLGRETVTFQVGSAFDVVTEKCVLVTGAGGSIGSELCRQLIQLQPSELILLGRGENSLFEIHSELVPIADSTHITTVVADIRDRSRLMVLASP